MITFHTSLLLFFRHGQVAVVELEQPFVARWKLLFADRLQYFTLFGREIHLPCRGPLLY